MKKEPKLAPCPLCGRQPRVTRSEFATPDSDGTKVECWSANTATCIGHGVDVHRRTRALAIAAWNKLCAPSSLRDVRRSFDKIRAKWRRDLGADPFGFADVAKLLPRGRSS